jgi:ribosomal protein L31
MKKTLVLAISFALIYSCSPKTKSTATEAPKPVSQTTTSVTSIQPATESAAVVDMAAAEKTCRTVCSGCHDFYPANAYTADKWPGIVKKMQKKAGFSDAEKTQILAYLNANARK